MVVSCAVCYIKSAAANLNLNAGVDWVTGALIGEPTIP